jgi:hypothetical protein
MPIDPSLDGFVVRCRLAAVDCGDGGGGAPAATGWIRIACVQALQQPPRKTDSQSRWPLLNPLKHVCQLLTLCHQKSLEFIARLRSKSTRVILSQVAGFRDDFIRLHTGPPASPESTRRTPLAGRSQAIRDEHILLVIWALRLVPIALAVFLFFKLKFLG